MACVCFAAVKSWATKALHQTIMVCGANNPLRLLAFFFISLSH